MVPLIWAFVRTYAPVIMIPVAAVVGVVGYNIENIISDKYTPFKPSIEEQREERLLKELKNTKTGNDASTLTEKKFVPKSIFERNLSPQLVDSKPRKENLSISVDNSINKNQASVNGTIKTKSDEDTQDFDTILRREWDLAQTNGLFRYKFNRNIPTKILLGKFHYILQLNLDRATKRRLPQEIQCLNQPFNPNMFNFKNAKSSEFIIQLKQKEEDEPSKESSDFILINVSPLEYGHVLIIPNLLNDEPQIVTVNGLKLTLEILLLNKSCDFRVGFNSLCAYASVNHQHYHGYYLEHRLFIETAELKQLAGPCKILVDEEYPAQGFVFVLSDLHHASMKQFITDSFKLISHLQVNNIAHNFYMTRASTRNLCRHFDSVRLYVWGRRSSYGAKECEGFNPALCELAGHFPIKASEIFDSITEVKIRNELSAICQIEFQELLPQVLRMYK